MNRAAPSTIGTGDTTAFQNRHQRWLELARDLRAAACLPGEFTLAPAGPIDVYIDVFLFETRPTILRRMAALMADLVDATTDRLAGRAEVAPLVTALSLETGLPFAVVPTPAAGDRPTQIEGELHAGERVVLVEDVIMSGSRATTAVHALRDRGAVVPAVLAAVDRSGGRGEAAARCPVRALFTPADLHIPDQPRVRDRQGTVDVQPA
ncbi:orotate phosphoribosyltransferase [Micromonospora sp. NPDC047620]|uniref:orotate phosphoribosyltransferase n=1 Tax=Micromonospora sp. NPDC047620 TaxID=3364251 RepID=UPI00371D5803